MIPEGVRQPPIGLCVRMLNESRSNLDYVVRNGRFPDYVHRDIQRAYLMLIEAHRTLDMYSKIHNRMGAE